MKNKIIVFALIITMVVLVVSLVPNTVSAESNLPLPIAQAGTPTPSGGIVVPGFTLQFYAPGPNPLVKEADAHGRIAGPLMGIWHGLISPVTLIISFNNPNVQMYEVHNDGSQYNLGFLIGVAILFLLLGVGVGSRRRR